MDEFEQERNQNEYVENYKKHQPPLDREKSIHSPELYAVWNLKTYLTYKMSRTNPFKSEFFIYTDSGAWRGATYADWPDETFVHSLADKLAGRLLYGQVGEPDQAQFTPYRDLIQGRFINYLYNTVVSVI